VLRKFIYNSAIGRTILFASTSVLGNILVGWWIADLSKEPLDFSLVLKSYSSLALLIYIVIFSYIISLEFSSSMKTKYLEAIFQSSIRRANESISRGNYDDVKKIEEILGVKK
jgi:hypothetical protein